MTAGAHRQFRDHQAAHRWPAEPEPGAAFWRLTAGRDGPRLVPVRSLPVRGLVLDTPTRKAMARACRAMRATAPHPPDIVRTRELLKSLERSPGIFTDQAQDAASLVELLHDFLEAARRLEPAINGLPAVR